MRLYKKGPELEIVIISNNSCVLGNAPLDEENRGIVEGAMKEIGLNGNIHVIPACNIYCGLIPKDVWKMLKEEFQKYGRIPLPAILINGKIVTSGEIDIEDIKTAFIRIKQDHDEGMNLNFIERLLKRTRNPG